MKRISYILKIASAAAAGAAASCSAGLITDAFSYSGTGTVPDPVFAASSVLEGAAASGTLGDGWVTEVELPAGADYSLYAGMPDDGNFNIYGDGTAGLIGEVTARRVFSGTELLTDETYSFSLGTENEALVSLLGSIDVEIGITDGVTDTVVASTADGTGLAGIVDFLGLFADSKTASFNFTAAASGGDLYVELQTGTLASLLGETVQFNNMDVTQIPEPATLAFIGLFGGGILIVRRLFMP